MRFKSKFAVVTGGASGIGRAAVLQFHREGAHVLVADIDGHNANRIVSELDDNTGRIAGIVADISTEEGASSVIDRCMELWGRIDILVNNAASFHFKRVEDVTKEDWDKVLGVNVLGTSFCSKYAVARMKGRETGNIVNVASINGLIAMPEWMTYNASKAAVIEMSKSMALDLGPFNIRVNCVCPGVTDTPALQKGLIDTGITEEQLIEAYIAPKCIIKRLGKPEEVASVITFLASDEASYMTGSTVVVDGGFTT